MNLPNKLTLLRVVLIPVFVVLLLLEGGQNYTLRIAALIVFCFASFTDFLDGQIARRNNLVTNFESSWTRLRISCWSAPR